MPPQPREHVTTEDLLAITHTARDTLYEWVARRLLPRPGVATGPGGHQFAVWPVEAVERVRFIVDRLGERLPLTDIASLVDERWPRR